MKKSFVIGKPAAKRRCVAALCLTLLSIHLPAESAPTPTRSSATGVSKAAPARKQTTPPPPSRVAAKAPAAAAKRVATPRNEKTARHVALTAKTSAKKTPRLTPALARKTPTPAHRQHAKASHFTPGRRPAVTPAAIAATPRVAPPAAKPGKEWGLNLHSSSALVYDQASGKILYEKDSHKIMPIASITKLMTAMVVLDAQPDLNELLTIGAEDVDTLRHSRSRLPVGTTLSRYELLRLALMSSENRAASLLARAYPGGKRAFVAAMNRKAQALGMLHTHFDDSTGLYATNVSNARDLARMVAAASQYSLIRELTTTASHQVKVGQQLLQFNNTNALVRNPQWRISVSKTGFINESGKCLVMQTWINNKPTIIVLLDSWGKLTPIGDSQRIRQWIEASAWDNTTAQGG